MNQIFPKFPNLNLDNSPIKKFVGELSNTEIKALPTGAGYDLVPRNGSKYVYPLLAILNSPVHVSDYTGIDADSRIWLSDGSGAIYTNRAGNDTGTSNTEVTDLLNALSLIILGPFTYAISDHDTLGNEANVVPGNKIAIQATNVAAFTGGSSTNTLRITLFYVEIDLT